MIGRVLLFAQDTAAAANDAAGDLLAGVDTDVTDKVPPPPVDDGPSAWPALLVTACVFVLPFVISWLVARWTGMKDLRFRLGTVLFCAALGLTPFLWNSVQAGSLAEGLRNSVRLGIDLAGGTNMIFQVDRTALAESGKELDDGIMEQMVGSIRKRINPSGTEEVEVRAVGGDRIEITVPGADDEKVERIRRVATTLGSLEFLILANRSDDGPRIDDALQLPGTERDLVRGGRRIYGWRSVAREKNEAGEFEGPLKIQPASPGDPSQVVSRWVDGDGNVVANPEPGVEYDLQYLTKLPDEDREVTGEYLLRAFQTYDETRQLAVGFNFNQQGAFRFGQLTSSNLPGAGGFFRRLAIVLDGKLWSAPTINSTISASGQISGGRLGFKRAEVDELVDVLNAGALEVPLDPTPVSEFTVSPLLGADTVKKAIYSIFWATVLVLVFMACYYLALGFVADLCLVLNILLVMGVMSLIEATFTLPGLAGIVLTIGMAVDANVLIFERIREEQARGSSLRLSIQNGFGRALSAIVDANVTTLIVAVILYLIGTEQVKGFAVTLFIGILTSMFTALFFGRLLCDVMERKGWVRRFKMFSVVGDTSIDFLSGRTIAAACSLALIVGGMAVLFVRGADILDIDFRGGTMVTFQLEEEAEPRDVRAALEALPEFTNAVSVERLELDEGDGEQGRRFRVRTTVRDREVMAAAGEGEPGDVAELIAAAFDASDLNIRRVTVEDRVAAGNDVTLTFSEPIGTGTVRRELGDALAARTADTPTPIDADDPPVVVAGVGDGIGGEGEAAAYDVIRVTRLETLPAADLDAALKFMEDDLARSPVFDEVNSFDAAVAGDMQRSAIFAILSSLLAIIGYIWFRFQRVDFGLAAVAALVHDVLFVLGAVAFASWLVGDLGLGGPLGFLGLEEFKLNLPMIAALLTVIGYSLNDTIVVFDRIREVRGKNPGLSNEIVNTSLNQTLARTLLTSFTTFIVVGILYAFGGEGIHGFAYCLVVGIVVGTYSSIFVASPVLVWLMNRKGAKVRPVPAKATPANVA